MTRRTDKDAQHHQPLRGANVHIDYYKTVSALCSVYLGNTKYSKKSVEKIFARIDSEMKICNTKMQLDLYLTGIINEECINSMKEIFDLYKELPPLSWFGLHPSLWADGSYSDERDKRMVEQTFQCLRKNLLPKT